MFDSLLQSSDAVYGTTSTVSMGSFIACLIAALVLGFGMSIVYMLTHKKEGYTQSYAITLIMLPPIVCVLLMLINFIGGIAIAGIFGLTRYRSVAADPKDIGSAGGDIQIQNSTVNSLVNNKRIDHGEV